MGALFRSLPAAVLKHHSEWRKGYDAIEQGDGSTQVRSHFTVGLKFHSNPISIHFNKVS